MDQEKIIVGALLLVVGLIFFFNNESIGKGTAKLYQKIYTEKNLKVIFKILGAILIIGGLVIMFVNE